MLCNTDTLYEKNVLPKTGSTEVPPEEEVEEEPEETKHESHEPLDKKGEVVDPEQFR